MTLGTPEYILIFSCAALIVVPVAIVIVLGIHSKKYKAANKAFYQTKVKPYIESKYSNLKYDPQSGIRLADFDNFKYFFVNNYFVSQNSVVGMVGKQTGDKPCNKRQFKMCQIYTSEQNPAPKLGYSAVTTFNTSNQSQAFGGGIVVIPSVQGRSYYGTLVSLSEPLCDGDAVIVSKSHTDICFRDSGYYGCNLVDVDDDRISSRFDVFSENTECLHKLAGSTMLDNVCGLHDSGQPVMVVSANSQTHILLINKYIIPNPKIKFMGRVDENAYFGELDENFWELLHIVND